MNGRKKCVDDLPQNFASIEQAAEFWDTHDTADYWKFTRPVTDFVFDIKRRRYLVSLKPSLSKRLAKAASQRGMTSEMLLNQWVKKQLDSLAPQRATKVQKRKSTARAR